MKKRNEIALAKPSIKKKHTKGNIKKLLSYLKPHKLGVIFTIIFSVVSVILIIASTLVLKDLTNTINTAALIAMNTAANISEILDINQVVKFCVMLIGIYLLTSILGYLSAFIMAKITQRVAQSLRKKLSIKINKIPLSYFDSNPLGDTLSRVTNDVDTIGQSLNSTVSTLISSLVQIVLVMVFMLVTRWQMALTELATLPLSFLLIFLLVKVSQKYFVRQQKYLGAVNGTIEEVFSGQMVVKAFNAEKRNESIFNQQNSNLQKAANTANIIAGTMHPLMSFISKLGYVAVCIVGGVLYANNLCDMGTLVAFIMYVNLFQAPINQLSQIVNTLQGGTAAAQRVFEFLEVPEQADESQKNTTLSPADCKGMVEFKNVKFGYDKNKTIINDFSVVIKPGQKVAIVGPTGAGKTTLVNLLMRFYEIDSGEILIDNVPISSLKRENVRQLFSMVLQDTWLFDGTVKENIVYTNQSVSDEQLNEIASAANINHFIAALPNNFNSMLEGESNISSGQKQLLTIARAMTENAPMLILDEATSNVDTRTEQLLQSAMDKLSCGKTCFVIAHRLSTIKNADLILVLCDGDIVECGNHDTLVQNQGFYYSLYNSQFSESTSN